MESKDEHGADGNEGDEAKMNVVEAATEVDNTKDREEVNNIIQCNMKNKLIFVDVPIKKNNTYEQGGDCDRDVLFEVEALQITSLLKEVTHKEKTNTTDESVESDIRCKVPVFVSTVQNHADDSDDKHDGFSLFLSVADICDPMHQEKGGQKPGNSIEFTGKVGIQLKQQGSYDGFYTIPHR